MQFGHVFVDQHGDDSLGERVALLTLKQEDAGVHSNRAPFHRF